MELAAYANDLVNFEPGCRVLFQGHSALDLIDFGTHLRNLKKREVDI